MNPTRSDGGAAHSAPPDPLLIPVSSASEAGLRANATRLADWLSAPGADVPLENVAHTLACRRTHLATRWVVEASSRAELVESLREGPSGGHTGTVVHSARPGIVFVFSGHGSQWTGMGRELLDTQPVFAAAVDELEEVGQAETGLSLRRLLTETPLESAGLATAQPAVFALQYGLARLWESWGVVPAAVVGHSMGEVTAAVVAGGLTPADGLRIVARRSALLERALGGTGAIVQVQATPAEAEELAERHGVSVSIYASPRSAVLGGTPEAIDGLVMALQSEDVYVRRIRGVDVPAHTSLMDGILPQLRALVADLPHTALRVPLYTTVLDDPRELAPCDADHWVANMRQPVRFRDAVTAAAQDGYSCFLELSGHPAVGPAIAETLEALGDSRPRTVTGSLRREAPALATLRANAADLFCHGIPLDWRTLQPGGSLTDAPTQAWQHQRFEPAATTPQTSGQWLHPFLGVHIRLPDSPVRHVWQSEIDLDRLPWLSEHRVADGVVLPGSAYCEVALAAACEAYDCGPDEVHVQDIDIRAVLQIDRGVTLTTILTEQDSGRIEISTGEGPLRTVHATARVGRVAAGPVDPLTGSALIEGAEGVERLAPDEIYQRLRGLGQLHGPAFAGLGKVLRGHDGDRVELAYDLAQPPVETGHAAYRLHPAFLDSFLHGLGAALREESAVTYLPAGMAGLRLTGDPARITGAQAVVDTDDATGDLLGTVVLRDAAGTAQCVLEGVRLRRTDISALPTSLDGKLFQLAWERSPLTAAQGARPEGEWLVTGDDAAAGEALAERLRSMGATARLSDGGDLAERLSAVPDGGTRTVVHLARSAAPGAADQDSAKDAEAAVVSFLGTVGALVGSAASQTRLFLVTTGAQVVEDGESPDVTQGGLRGMARTLVLEHPELVPVHLDTDARGPELADVLLAELGGTERAEEVAWRAGERHVAQLRPVAAGSGPDDPRVFARPDGAYAVSGGLRGLGLHTARLLAQRGAGHLVLIGRSEPDEETTRILADIRKRGTSVSVVTGDIADPATADEIDKALATTPHPLRGVVHAAAGFSDRTLRDLGADTVAHVWRAKAEGAVRLHRLAEKADLDWWVSYSSMASAMGSAGQAAYASANSYLDSFTRWRSARGLPSVVINWGTWKTVGAARTATLSGVEALRVDEGSAALIHLVEAGSRAAGVIRFVPEELGAAHPELANSPFLRRVVAASGTAPEPLQVVTPGADPEQAAEQVRQYVREQICRILGFRRSTLPVQRPMVHMGLDSLSAVKIKNAVHAGLGIDLPVALLLQGVSVEALEDHLLGQLLPRTAAAPRTPAPPEASAARARRRDRAGLAAQRKQRRSAP